jgi:hypothetical protein
VVDVGIIENGCNIDIGFDCCVIIQNRVMKGFNYIEDNNLTIVTTHIKRYISLIIIVVVILVILVILIVTDILVLLLDFIK